MPGNKHANEAHQSTPMAFPYSRAREVEMTRMFLAVLTALGMTVAAGAVSAGETLDRVTSSGALKVATNSGWPPQSFLDDNNEMVGFDIDVAKEIAKRLGAEATFETPEWAVMTGGHWHGRWDLAVGSITPTKARAGVIDFAGIYYYSPYVFAVHKDSQANSIADLNGKKIGVETGTTSEDYIRRRLQIDAPDAPEVTYTLEPGEVLTYADSMLPFDDLRLGDGVRVDAVITPEQTAMGAIKNGYPIKILPGEYAFKEPLVVVADKGDPEWTTKLGGIIKDMKNDGTLSALTTKWYGKDYSN
jgi:polar amino acid transport system substrate-binding protein